MKKKSKARIVSKAESKTLRVLPSIIVVGNEGKAMSYVLDAEPMTKDQYLKFQETLGQDMKITFSMRVVKK